MPITNKTSKQSYMIYLTTERKDKLRHYAEAQNLNMSDIINYFLDCLPAPEVATVKQQKEAFFKLMAIAKSEI